MENSFEEKLLKLLNKAETLYKKKAFLREIEEVYQEACNVVRDYCSDCKSKTYDNTKFASIIKTNKVIKKIQNICFARSKDQKEMNVGDLIKKLSEFDKNTPVKVSYYVSCMTDSGTDMGGDEERPIEDIYDLQTRIVLHT
jgi:hypothetical protein